jgi:hypothetical protein
MKFTWAGPTSAPYGCATFCPANDGYRRSQILLHVWDLGMEGDKWRWPSKFVSSTCKTSSPDTNRPLSGPIAELEGALQGLILQAGIGKVSTKLPNVAFDLSHISHDDEEGEGKWAFREWHKVLRYVKCHGLFCFLFCFILLNDHGRSPWSMISRHPTSRSWSQQTRLYTVICND